jgi:Fatty acid desaturase
VRHWGIENLTGLSDAAERARDALLTRIRRIRKAGERLARRRAETGRGMPGGRVPATA